MEKGKLGVGGKVSLEWDLNDWRWDGDLFKATPLNSDKVEKRRRPNEEAGVASVNLKLGITEDKKTKTVAAVLCQVEDCRADLTTAKDYHRRHKVCDMHSKATKALVSNTMQRFCQQCSRFHVLQEFDEGKRSCRRRLAGHNRRRRKTHPDSDTTTTPLNDQTSSTYLLISLLRILSNMHSNNSDQTRDQDLLSHLLKSLTSIAGSRGLVNAGTSVEASQKPLDVISDAPEPCRPIGLASKVDDPISLGTRVSASDKQQMTTCSVDVNAGNGILQTLSGPGSTNPHHSAKPMAMTPDVVVGAIKFNNIDLNSIYDDSQDLGNSHLPVTSHDIQHDLNLSSPPHQSRNSDSTSTQSPSTSTGEAQSRTDRIVFKLFGKDPDDLPFPLRTQILNWLAHRPCDIESYIRPGCIILTIYLHLEKLTWEELCHDLGSSLKKLLDTSNDPFWRTGWVYSRVQNSVAFMSNGQLVLDTPLPLKSYNSCRISSIKPVAVALSERAEFVVKGFDLNRPSMRLQCALDGKYLAQEICYDLTDNTDTTIEHNGIQSLRFSCSIPSVTGRGFIEVEDQGLSSSFFPFIVVEQEVCTEIRMLEGAIEVGETAGDVQSQPDTTEALEFIHEMGWLLHRSHVQFRLGHMNPNSDLFPFRRFRWLMEFSMDHDWCFVVKKLLGILFEGIVDAGEHSSIEVAILDVGLLHRAVRRNCRPMVELLLKFVPQKGINKAEQDKGYLSFLFKPDHVGPMGLTPVHVAANQEGCESVLDALTDDPGKVGIEVWKNVKDESGLTPNDYACLRGHYSYIHLVQRKTRKGRSESESESGEVVVDIVEYNKRGKVGRLEIDKCERKWCRACEQKVIYGRRSWLVYKPAMVSMVAIAAVCVCVALLFKSCPEVVYVFQPFRWERLKYGSS